MRTAKALSVVVAGLATATVLSLGTSASAVTPASPGDASPSAGHVSVDGHRVVRGTTIGEWGRTTDGELYSFTYKAGETRPAAPAAPAARCSVYISDVAFHGAGAGAWFQWETSQACSGSFGSQKLQTQMWRSSWSGPRGYNNWHGTDATSNNFIDFGWSSDCNDGGGTYTYYPVMQGYASGIGWGPTTRSNNDLRKGCGTRAPNP
ncbi:hypothetical protein AF335_08580 [Streptomyces eurocidicus]|uniref:Uncharacterized protein n=1 Tax=Streptomyces eurocidicus TaxID=66423 RepID=A0A2N8P0P8_STREU|nr:hypothetical protein [Streptomyces eurocidicus]MBB5122084.1 hypothetical protein [Streptomyces eurocidicus]MBF6055416.1 hypothetical protein [Streptomyces eurocidicus]PNE34596.1 hypothetical protein AF335_08580 [Streptomyces eurocidicus]